MTLCEVGVLWTRWLTVFSDGWTGLRKSYVSLSCSLKSARQVEHVFRNSNYFTVSAFASKRTKVHHWNKNSSSWRNTRFRKFTRRKFSTQSLWRLITLTCPTVNYADTLQTPHVAWYIWQPCFREIVKLTLNIGQGNVSTWDVLWMYRVRGDMIAFWLTMS